MNSHGNQLSLLNRPLILKLMKVKVTIFFNYKDGYWIVHKKLVCDEIFTIFCKSTHYSMLVLEY